MLYIKKDNRLSGGLDSTLIASLTKEQDNMSASTVKWIGPAESIQMMVKDGWMNLIMAEYDMAMTTAANFVASNSNRNKKKRCTQI